MARTVFERLAPDPSLIAESLAGSALGSFWLEGLKRPPVERLTSAIDCDLLVVGGGYCGLWTAIIAKQRDPSARVVLLEAATVGWAASGRNGGFVEASLTHGDENGRSRWPDEMDTLDRLGHENLDAIERTVRDYALDCDFRRDGSLSVAVEEHQVQWLRDEAGEHAEFLDRDAIQREVHSPTYLAGLWDKRSTATVDPGKLAFELARLARELGVLLFERSKVLGLESDGPTSGPVIARTEAAYVSAKRVALATNVFPSLLKRFRLHTVPVYDYVLMTEPLSDEAWASLGWNTHQGISDLANQFHYYRRTADGRILFGGYDAVYHYGGRVRARYEDRPQSYERLASHFLTTFPQLAGVRFSHRWAGAIDTCSRFCAFFGLARQGRVASAAGFTGLGVASTRFAAEVMLDRLAGDATERTDLRMVSEIPMPFPPEPAASMAVNAVRRSLDLADHRQGRRDPFLRTLDTLGLGFDS